VAGKICSWLPSWLDRYEGGRQLKVGRLLVKLVGLNHDRRSKVSIVVNRRKKVDTDAWKFEVSSNKTKLSLHQFSLVLFELTSKSHVPRFVYAAKV